MAKINKIGLNNSEIKILIKKFGVKSLDEVKIEMLKLLKENLKKGLTDVRQSWKITYKIWDVIICVIVADFASVYDWEEIQDFVQIHYKWFKSFLQMTGGVPSAQTFERIFSLIKHEELEKILIDFYQRVLLNVLMNRDIENIDGRVSRGSARNKTDYHDKERPLNVLNVYSNNYGICLASEKIDEKTNEIPTIPTILKRINVKGNIITWDALNTQTANVKTVIDGKGDYVAPIKGNQGNFYNDLIQYFDDKALETIIAGKLQTAYLKQVEKSHSAIITYEYFQTEDVDWYFDKKSWQGLKSIGLVKKTTVKNGKTIVEIRYYISSLHIDILDFAKAIRLHWSVENKLHWHLDFTFKQDGNTTKNKDALMNLEIVNKFTLATLNKIKPRFSNISIKRMRNYITNDFENSFMELLCFLALA